MKKIAKKIIVFLILLVSLSTGFVFFAGADDAFADELQKLPALTELNWDKSTGILTWQLPAVGQIVEYQLRRDGEIVSNGATTEKLIYPREILESGTYTYTLINCDMEGWLDSDPVITIPWEYKKPAASLEKPQNLRWRSENSGVAEWDAVEGAWNYNVYAYREGEEDCLGVNRPQNAEPCVDLSMYTDKPGKYTFEVLALSSKLSEKSSSISDRSDVYVKGGDGGDVTTPFDGKTWTTKNTDKPKKEWTIKFNQEIKEASINESNIYIADVSGNKIPSSFDISFDKKAVTITPSSEFLGYEAGKTYYLYVLKGAYSMINTTLKESIRMPFVYAAGDNIIAAPDPECLEVKYLPGEDRYGNDYWVVASKEIVIPKNCTLYAYYGWEDSADKISLQTRGNVLAWCYSDGDKVYSEGDKIASSRAQPGQYIYYRFIQGTSFNGTPVSHNPDIPEGTPVSEWIADGKITNN